MSVGSKIDSFFDRKIAALYAEAQRLAAEALAELQGQQRDNQFWNNETFQALQRLFADAFQDDDAVGFFLAHGVEYGVYLELANNRQNEALRPMIEKYALKFKLFAQELFGSAA
jgi:hypothetical protein